MVLQTFVPYCVFFLCVYVYVMNTEEKKATSRGSNVWNKVHENFYVERKKRQKERSVKEIAKEKKCSKGVRYMKSISQFAEGSLNYEAKLPSNVLD